MSRAPSCQAGARTRQSVPHEDWDRPPWNRWTFQHVREFVPTAQVRRGTGPVTPLPRAVRDLDSISFESDGVRQTVREFLDSSYTDGFLVLHRGRILAEHYANDMTESTAHLSQSVAKSVVGSVAGILAARGMLDLGAPLTHYLPELAPTAYRGATAQHLLDMTSGVAWDETYTATDSDCARMDVACGWKAPKDPTWPRSMWEQILTLKRTERPHGQLFAYRSIETDVLGFVLEQVSGVRLPELVSRELWMPLGAEEDAYFTVDPAGFACASGGFNATLRDYARFALMLAGGGRIGGHSVVPAAWIEETRAANHALFRGTYLEVLPHGGYHNQFWIEDREQRALMARGVFGQLIYIDPQAEFAAVKLSSWPEFVSAPRARTALAALRAVRAALAKTAPGAA